jgi:hypothetical protein
MQLKYKPLSHFPLATDTPLMSPVPLHPGEVMSAPGPDAQAAPKIRRKASTAIVDGSVSPPVADDGAARVKSKKKSSQAAAADLSPAYPDLALEAAVATALLKKKKKAALDVDSPNAVEAVALNVSADDGSAAAVTTPTNRSKLESPCVSPVYADSVLEAAVATALLQKKKKAALDDDLPIAVEAVDQLPAKVKSAKNRQGSGSPSDELQPPSPSIADAPGADAAIKIKKKKKVPADSAPADSASGMCTRVYPLRRIFSCAYT